MVPFCCQMGPPCPLSPPNAVLTKGRWPLSIYLSSCEEKDGRLCCNRPFPCSLSLYLTYTCIYFSLKISLSNSQSYEEGLRGEKGRKRRNGPRRRKTQRERGCKNKLNAFIYLSLAQKHFSLTQWHVMEDSEPHNLTVLDDVHGSRGRGRYIYIERERERHIFTSLS